MCVCMYAGRGVGRHVCLYAYMGPNVHLPKTNLLTCASSSQLCIGCACRALASLHPQNHRPNNYTEPDTSHTSLVHLKSKNNLSGRVCRAAQIHQVTPSLCRVGPNQASLPWLPWALHATGARKAHRAHGARRCSVRCSVTFCKEGCSQRWAFPQQRTQ